MKTCTAVLFLGVLALLVLGLVTIVGIEGNARWDHSAEGDLNSGLFQRQALWAAIGLIMMLVVARTGDQYWRVLAAPFLLLVIGLLVMVLIPGVGIWDRGTTQILPLGPIRIQPSALVKLAVPLFLAWWFTHGNSDRWWKPAMPIATLALTVVSIGFYYDNAPRDFITAVVGEELGWIGLVLMLLAFIMILGAGALEENRGL